MGAMVLGQITGLISTSLVGSTFGAGIESEAYFAGNRFAEILFNLMAGGALGSAFIPTFTGLLAEEKRARAWKLASSIANLLLLVLTLVSILSWIFARPIVDNILAPGFDPHKAQLTAQMLRIQLPSAIIFGLSGLVMGILNAHQHFLLPALAPAMYRIGIIFGTLVLSRFMGIAGAAWGVVVGSAAASAGTAARVAAAAAQNLYPHARVRYRRGARGGPPDGSAPAGRGGCAAQLLAEHLSGLLPA